MDLHTHGIWCMPEALSCVHGKPDRAGGPVINTRQDTWKPFQAGGHIVYIWDARQNGIPDDLQNCIIHGECQVDGSHVDREAMR